jgi:hypothetical protein
MELVTDDTSNQFMPHARSRGRDFILKHIYIICGNEILVYLYMICWIAQMLQFPGIKSNFPMIISLPGAGKGKFMKTLGRLVGESKIIESTQPSRDVWGDFNGMMMNAFIVNLDELDKSEMIKCRGRFKGLVTNPTMMINPKNVNAFRTPAFHRFIGTSNTFDAVHNEKGERRNWVVRASDELCGNQKYFNQLEAYLNDDNVIKTLFDYFKSIPNMENFGDIPRPQTAYHKNLSDLGVSPLEQWLKAFAMEKNGLVTILSGEACKVYNYWRTTNGFTDFTVNAQKFGCELKALMLTGLPGIDKGRETNKGNELIFDTAALRKHFGVGALIIIPDSE